MTQHKKSEIQKIIELVDALPVDAQMELIEMLALRTTKVQPPEWHKPLVLEGLAEIAAGKSIDGEEAKRQTWAAHLARKAARKSV